VGKKERERTSKQQRGKEGGGESKYEREEGSKKEERGRQGERERERVREKE